VRAVFIFDPQSLATGILKAAKMRARANSVNSLRHRSNFGVNCASGEPVWHTRFDFQSRFFFMRRKINFSFFLVDFGGGF
jgi:hypothetical protein